MPRSILQIWLKQELEQGAAEILERETFEREKARLAAGGQPRPEVSLLGELPEKPDPE